LTVVGGGCGVSGDGCSGGGCSGGAAAIGGGGAAAVGGCDGGAGAGVIVIFILVIIFVSGITAFHWQMIVTSDSRSWCCSCAIFFLFFQKVRILGCYLSWRRSFGRGYSAV